MLSLFMHPSLIWLISQKLQPCLNIFTQYGLGQIGSMVWGGAIMTSNSNLGKRVQSFNVICYSGSGAMAALHVQQRTFPTAFGKPIPASEML